MRSFLLFVVIFLSSFGFANACDDHIGKCEIEAWRSYKTAGGWLTIEGSATCDSGSINIRLYDGEEFLGIADGFIEGHALSAIAMNIQNPQSLSIKYSIDPSY